MLMAHLVCGGLVVKAEIVGSCCEKSTVQQTRGLDTPTTCVSHKSVVYSTRPKGLRCEAGAFGEGAQLGPGEVGVDAAAEAAIGAGNDVFAADDRGVAHDAVGDKLRVL